MFTLFKILSRKLSALFIAEFLKFVPFSLIPFQFSLEFPDYSAVEDNYETTGG